MARDRSRETVRSLARMHEESANLSIEELAAVIALMRSTDIEEIHIERASDAMMLHLVRPPFAPVDGVANGADLEREVADGAGATDPNSSVEPSSNGHLVAVTAELVGKFHVGTHPGTREGFDAGEQVKQGQTLGTIETLGSFIEVEAPISGTIKASEVVEGETVEFGQQLLTIAPAESAEA